jgi:hypothetical protein
MEINVFLKIIRISSHPLSRLGQIEMPKYGQLPLASAHIWQLPTPSIKEMRRACSFSVGTQIALHIDAKLWVSME